MMKIDRVSSVAFYPVKGAQAATINGEIPTILTVGQTGFEVNDVRDRDWVPFDPNENAFVSQRGWGAEGRRIKYPQDRALAAVGVDLRDDHVAITSRVGTLELPPSLVYQTRDAERSFA